MCVCSLTCGAPLRGKCYSVDNIQLLKGIEVIRRFSSVTKTVFVTDEDLLGQNVLQIDLIAMCSLETDYVPLYSAP